MFRSACACRLLAIRYGLRYRVTQTDKGGPSVPLLHINMAVMTVACLLLLVGFSLREYVWGPGMMLLGSLTIMGLIIYDIRILSAMS